MSKISPLTRFICLLTLVLALLAAERTALAAEVLKIGATPGENIELTRGRYELISNYIEKETGIKTELYLATDYTGVIEAMRAGKIDIASFGPLSYVLANNVAGVEGFAKEYREGAGSTYTGYIIARKDSGINSIKDLKGKTFAYVDPASTGGHLIPRKEMLKKGIDPEKDLKNTVYLGSHDQVALGVYHKRVDAGAVVNINYEPFLDSKVINGDELQVIDRSDPFPGSAWAWRKDLPAETKTKVRDALLGLRAENAPELKDFLRKVTKYEPADDSEWDSIRETVNLLHIDLTK